LVVVVQQSELAGLRRDLTISRRETEDAHEFAQAIANEREEIRKQLRTVTQQCSSLQTELVEKGSVVSQLTSQLHDAQMQLAAANTPRQPGSSSNSRSSPAPLAPIVQPGEEKIISPFAAEIISQLQGKVDVLKAKLAELSEEIMRVESNKSDLRTRWREEVEAELKRKFDAERTSAQTHAKTDAELALKSEFESRLSASDAAHRDELQQVAWRQRILERRLLPTSLCVCWGRVCVPPVGKQVALYSRESTNDR
jgi:predicted  nucleic acid-binding Zn-ribbon protein